MGRFPWQALLSLQGRWTRGQSQLGGHAARARAGVGGRYAVESIYYIGGPDAGFFMYFEDVDFCYRAAQRYRGQIRFWGMAWARSWSCSRG